MADIPEQALEVTVREAAEQADDGRPLIDIRSAAEQQAGDITIAMRMNPDDLLRAVQADDDRFRRGGFVLCARGVGSLELVRRLEASGHSGFFSVRGGFQAWQAAGLPLRYPSGFDARQAERYARHLVLPQVGPEGQRRLLASRILLAGLGGLNSPVALYLAAAGVGTIGLADFDAVERSNLQRQVLHDEEQLGRPKTESAASRVRDLNPDVTTVIIDEAIGPGNAAGLVADWDIVVDGTDSFGARYALNEACLSHGRPLVYGAVMRFQGQVSVFWPAGRKTGSTPLPCFRCMLPEQPAAADTPSCSDAGVLGVLPGIIGTLQAGEALKLALGIGDSLAGRLLLVDALGPEFRTVRLEARPDCPACGAWPASPDPWAESEPNQRC